MQTHENNVMCVERKYIDVPLGVICSSTPQNVSRQVTQQPAHELGIRLMELAKKGDSEGVREMMNCGAPFTTDWLGTSPLHYAAQYNHVDTVEILLKAGISRDARNKVERTPLHVAAQEGHTEVVKLLIKFCADVDCKDMLRMTPLHWAAENGQAECIRVLLDFGADPVVLNKFDKTPFTIAFENDRLDIVKMLQDATLVDPVTRKVLREHSLSSIADNTVISGGQPSPLQSSHPTQQPHSIQQEETLPSNGQIFKLHKIVGRRKINVQNQKQNELQTQRMTERAVSGVVSMTNNSSVPNQFNLQDANHTETISATHTLQMLQEHGITMLPAEDDSSTVASAVQGGQTVVLTEAGKMALNLTKLNKIPGSNVVKRPLQLVTTTKQIKTTPQKVVISPGRKLIRVQPEELINMAREKKVIIHTGDKKLGRPGQIIFSKPIRTINAVNNKSLDSNQAKIVTTTLPIITKNTTTVVTPVISSVSVNSNSSSSNNISISNSNKSSVEIIKKEVDLKDYDSVKKQLEEMTQKYEMYKEKFLVQKEKAELYRMKLESLGVSSEQLV